MAGTDPRYRDGFDSFDDDFDDDLGPQDDFGGVYAANASGQEESFFDDDFDDDFDDQPASAGVNDDAGYYGDGYVCDSFELAPPAGQPEEDPQDILSPDRQEEWEVYLDRMAPASAEGGKRGRSRSRRPQDGSYPPEENYFGGDDGKEKTGGKGGKGGLIVTLLLLLAAVGAGLYIYFCTDLYFVAEVTVDTRSMNLYVGDSGSVSCRTTVFGSGEPQLEWSSSNGSVAQVDAEGNISALSQGVATITVTETKSGRAADCVVSVYRMDQIIPQFTQITLGAGESRVLGVTMGSHNEGVPEFSVSHSDVAAVDSYGTITASAPGSTTVTVSAHGFDSVSCAVTVMKAPTALAAQASGKLCVGESRSMNVQAGEGEFSSQYTYTSADPSVVEVDSSGLLSAKGKGETVVTVTAYNGVSLELPVTVSGEPTSVEMPKKLKVYSGQPVSLGATDKSGSCAQFFYTVSDPSVLSVDEQGMVTVHKQGEAVVTATAYNGVSAECRVTTAIVDYTTPYTSQMVYDNIAALQATYPDFISTESIGKSTLGKDITLLKMGTGAKKVLVVAGMHSREGIAVTFTMRCIDEYAQAMAAGKKYGRYNVKKLLEEYTIYFVPLINPDGMDIFEGVEKPLFIDRELTQEELDELKATATGVNLNRNFPFEWGAEGVNVTTPDHRSYAGSAAASEPETKAIIDLCAANQFEWLLDMHCKGHLIYYQDKVNTVDEYTEFLARRLYTRFGFTLTDRSNVFEISGGLENWFRKEYGKPGICVELVGSKFSSEVNQYFDKKIEWDKIRGIFLACLED